MASWRPGLCSLISLFSRWGFGLWSLLGGAAKACVDVCGKSWRPPLTSLAVAPHQHHTHSQVTSAGPTDTIPPMSLLMVPASRIIRYTVRSPRKCECQLSHGTPQMSVRHLELESGPRVQNLSNPTPRQQLSLWCMLPLPKATRVAHTAQPEGAASSRRGLEWLWALVLTSRIELWRGSLQ